MWLNLLLLLDGVHAMPKPQAVTGITGTATTIPFSTAVPSITLSTSVPAPTAQLSAPLPAQQPLPPQQAWCPSQIFCAGEILQTINLAQIYADPKTIVDKPTNLSSQVVFNNFNSLVLSTNGNASTTNVSALTEGDIVSFMEANFRGEGLELEAVALPGFKRNPTFLSGVQDEFVRLFSQVVHGFWTQLARGTNSNVLCGEGTNAGPSGCESTLIPLNHTFVVPGGRFREQYYWDSYWIILGLIQSELFSTANDTLQNFMDEVETFGFIPNGGRIYYLNRSQPPLFIHMLTAYVQATNDTSILTRALPLAERELQFWQTNRTTNVTSPFTSATHTMYLYGVTNSAPRPESYLQDYLTANDPTLTTPLTEDEKEALYSELATGAETGWDYTVRFAEDPFAGGSNDTNPILRTLNVKGTVPICLNSILYKAKQNLASLYLLPSSTTTPPPSTNADSPSTRASQLQSEAALLRTGIIDLFWDASKLAFYDFNLTSSSRNAFFSAAHFYPFWSGIFPDDVLGDENKMFGAYASVNMVMARYNGTFPTSFVESGLQWDAPNAWPPHQFIILSALQNVPSNLSTIPLPLPASGQTTFDLIPAGQLNISQGSLLGQPIALGTTNETAGVDFNLANGTVVNGGNATASGGGETWNVRLQRQLANRYLTSVFCSWHATGGSIPGVLPQLPAADLDVTLSANNTGNMFEKFSVTDVNSAGRGGEYTVQSGFGWTNGVVLWVAGTYGNVLVTPSCPPLTKSDVQSSKSGASRVTVRGSGMGWVVAVAGLAGALVTL